MIRNFVRPVRKQVAVLVLLGVGLTGAPALAAVAAPSPAGIQSKPRVLKLPRLSLRDIDTYRQRIKRFVFMDRRDAERVRYLNLMLDYLQSLLSETASTGERRYRLTQLQNFVAGQKAERADIDSEAPAAMPIEQERIAGPSADPVCYHEGQESECATDEEIAETDALAAVTAYENEIGEQQLDEMMLMMGLAPEAWPADLEACEDRPRGPAGENCVDQAVNATAALGTSAAAIIGWEGAKADALAAATKVSKATRVGWHITIGTAGFMFGYFLGSLGTCLGSIVEAPGAAPALPEPVFALRQ